MNNKVRPIGWATTILNVTDAWKSIMTIKNSPLRNLPPQLGLMVFSILAIMWSGIFITAMTFDSAEKYSAPQDYNSRGIGGEHE